MCIFMWSTETNKLFQYKPNECNIDPMVFLDIPKRKRDVRQWNMEYNLETASWLDWDGSKWPANRKKKNVNNKTGLHKADLRNIARGLENSRDR